MQAVLDLVPQCGATQGPLDGLIEHALFVHALNTQPVHHVLVNGLRKRVGLLEHHADPATQLGDVLAFGVDVVAIELDLALYTAAVHQIVHAVEGAQQGGLATPGRPDEGGHALFRDVHADVEQRLLLAIEEIQPRHFQRNGFVRQIQHLALATQGRHVDAVGVGFVLHGLSPFVAASL